MEMQYRLRRMLVVFSLGLGIMLWGQAGMAKDFPTKSITLMICMRPGAGADLGARTIAQEAGKILGQEIVPMNKPGGGGAVAAGILATSKPDGYTLLSCTNGAITTTPHLASVPYDPLEDLIPIVQFGKLISGIVVRSDSPHNSFKEFVEFARKNPGKLSYGFPGIGTAPHLAMEHVILEEKVNISTVPFQGSVPSLTALLGGHVSACGVSTSGFLPHLRAGKVKVLATTGDKRIEVLPDTPTLSELGYPYGVLIDEYLIIGPKGIPPATLKTLERALLKSMDTPAFKSFAEKLYLYVKTPLYGQQYKEHIASLFAKNGEIIQKANLGKK